MTISKDNVELHFIVLLNSFVPMIVLQIALESFFITFYRMMAALIMLFLLHTVRNSFTKITWKEKITLLATGTLTMLYWTLLIISAKTANTSVALVGMATTSLWISFIDPIIFKRKPQTFQHLIGINAVIAVYIIFNSKFEYGYGLGLGILGSFFAALVTIINAQLSRRYETLFITFYQMLGGMLGLAVFIPFYLLFFGNAAIKYIPSFYDISWVITMAFIFSIYAYSVLIRVMKTISPFMVSLVANLSPVYGILISIVFTEDASRMTKGFFIGAFMLLISVFAYPVLIYYTQKFKNQES